MTESQRKQLLWRTVRKQLGKPMPERKLTLIVEIPPTRKREVDQDTRNFGGKISSASLALVADPDEYRRTLRPTIKAHNVMTIGEESGAIHVNPDQLYQMARCVFALWRTHYAY